MEFSINIKKSPSFTTRERALCCASEEYEHIILPLNPIVCSPVLSYTIGKFHSLEKRASDLLRAANAESIWWEW